MTDEEKAVLDALAVAITEAIPLPWEAGPTPFYLRMGQRSASDGTPPLTLRSPAHSEEIATIWTCLLPTKANAILLVSAVNNLPWLLASIRRLDVENAELRAALALAKG